MPSLRSLTLHRTTSASSFIPANYPNLTKLDLSHASQFPLPNLAFWPNLAVLHLCSPTYLGWPDAVLDRFLPQIKNLTSLRELYISDTIPLVFPLHDRSQCTQLPLTSLHLEDHREGGAAIYAFLSNFAMPALQELSLTSLGMIGGDESYRVSTALQMFSPISTNRSDPPCFSITEFTHLHIDFDYKAGERLSFIMWNENKEYLPVGQG